MTGGLPLDDAPVAPGPRPPAPQPVPAVPEPVGAIDASWFDADDDDGRDDGDWEFGDPDRGPADCDRQAAEFDPVLSDRVFWGLMFASALGLPYIALLVAL